MVIPKEQARTILPLNLNTTNWLIEEINQMQKNG